jgi:hypothetical protein
MTKPLVILVLENAEMICRLAGLDSITVVIDGKAYKYERRR